MVISRSPPHAFLDRLPQQVPPAREARHHGADRHPGHLGDLLVAQVLELAHHQHLAIRDRQLLERLVHQLLLRALQHDHFRVRFGGGNPRDRLGIGGPQSPGLAPPHPPPPALPPPPVPALSHPPPPPPPATPT